MGVVLYRIGNTHTINGWECEKHIFDPDYLNFAARLREGWFKSPDCGRSKQNGLQQEIIDDEKEQEKPEEKKVIPKEKIINMPYLRMKKFARENGLSCARMNKPDLTNFLIEKLCGGENDIQVRSDQQCIQSVEDQRSYDDIA